jgi:IS5 family transposase
VGAASARRVCGLEDLRDHRDYYTFVPYLSRRIEGGLALPMFLGGSSYGTSLAPVYSATVAEDLDEREVEN